MNGSSHYSDEMKALFKRADAELGIAGADHGVPTRCLQDYYHLLKLPRAAGPARKHSDSWGHVGRHMAQDLASSEAAGRVLLDAVAEARGKPKAHGPVLEWGPGVFHDYWRLLAALRQGALPARGTDRKALGQIRQILNKPVEPTECKRLIENLILNWEGVGEKYNLRNKKDFPEPGLLLAMLDVLREDTAKGGTVSIGGGHSFLPVQRDPSRTGSWWG